MKKLSNEFMEKILNDSAWRFRQASYRTLAFGQPLLNREKKN